MLPQSDSRVRFAVLLDKKNDKFRGTAKMGNSVKTTSDGMTTTTQVVECAEGCVTRIMIRNVKGCLLYGYRLRSDETTDEAVEK